MDYAEHGSLEGYVKAYGDKDVPENEVLLIMVQVCIGLHFLHNKEKSIIHRDIQHRNILINKDGVIKIADFGISS